MRDCLPRRPGRQGDLPAGAADPDEVEYAHEMRYSDPLIKAGDLTMAISQSGETADTLAAARLAADRGSRLLALTNVVG